MEKLKQHLGKYLPKNPFTLGKDAWYYIEVEGIIVVDGPKESQVMMPWSEVLTAVFEYEEAKKRQHEAAKDTSKSTNK